MLPVDLAYLHRHCTRLVIWTLFDYCEFTLLSGVCRFDDRDEVNKAGLPNYHGDSSTVLLKVFDLEQDVTFNVRFFTPSHLEPFFPDMDGLLGSFFQRSDRHVPDSVHLHGQSARHHLSTAPRSV